MNWRIRYALWWALENRTILALVAGVLLWFLLYAYLYATCDEMCQMLMPRRRWLFN